MSDLSNLFELFECLVIVLSQDGTILEINQAALDLYCWKKRDVLNKDFSLLLKKHNFKNPLPDFLSSVENVVLKNIIIISNKNKKARTISWNIYSTDNLQANFSKGIILIGKDISLQRELEEKVYELDSVIAQMPGNVYWYDKNHIYLGCNENSARNLGMSREETVGQDFKALMKNIKNFPDASIEKWMQDGIEAMRTRKPKLNILEEPFMGPDNELIYTITNKVPLFNKGGKVVGVVGITTDITAQYKLKEAEERLAGIKALSASIAHELRTPLGAIKFGINGVKGYLPILVKAYNAAKAHNLDIEPIQSQHLQILSEVFDDMESEVTYSETIITMILMNVKQQGVSTADFRVYSMCECIEEAMRRYPFKPDEEILVDWDRKNDFYFFGDKTLMVHVLFNLLKNALYYIQVAKKGKIQIWHDKKENNNVLYFKDTGKGIPSDVLPNLFEKFYSTTYHGTGLGLAFCKMVMTSFGGSISCTSEYGEFTLFEMVFPEHKT